MAVLQDININVHGQPSEKRLQTFLRLSQNENGRMINFRVLGPPLPSGCTATFSGTKPDGNVYSKTGTVAGNFVIVQEDMQMTVVAGVWDAKLDIINGSHNIMTALIRVVVDADVVDPDAIASDSQLQGLVAEAKYYAEHARTDAYGSPLTATAAAEMTDKTRVYVYTGSETGMTAGNWYYWNGSAWTSGGVYNAVAVQTDTTLSVAGKAADGKATGDAIEELKEDLSDVYDELYITRLPLINSDDWENGGLSSAGVENASQYFVRTGFKLVSPSTQMAWCGNYTSGMASFAYYYTKDKVFISREGFIATPITVPANAVYIRFTFGFTSASGITVATYGFDNLVGDWKIEEINTPRDLVKSVVNDLNHVLVVGENTKNEFNEIPLVFYNNVIDNIKTSVFIDVLSLQGNRIYYESITNANINVVVKFYNNKYITNSTLDIQLTSPYGYFDVPSDRYYMKVIVSNGGNIRMFTWTGNHFGFPLTGTYNVPINNNGTITEVRQPAEGLTAVTLPRNIRYIMCVDDWTIMAVYAITSAGSQTNIIPRITTPTQFCVLYPEQRGNLYNIVVLAHNYNYSDGTYDKMQVIGSMDDAISCYTESEVRAINEKLVGRYTMLTSNVICDDADLIEAIEWTCLKDIDSVKSTVENPYLFHEGIKYRGVPYGSNWKTAHYFGWHISKHTLLNAINDKDSIFYTDVSEDKKGPYYSLVCSSYATLLSKFEYPTTNYGIMHDPRIHITKEFTPQVGQLYTNGYDHCLVAGGIYSDASASEIEVYECGTPSTHRRIYLSDVFSTRNITEENSRSTMNRYVFKANYVYTTNKPSPYNISSGTITNGGIRPYRGDKSVYTDLMDVAMNIKDDNATTLYYAACDSNLNIVGETLSISINGASTINIDKGTLQDGTIYAVWCDTNSTKEYFEYYEVSNITVAVTQVNENLVFDVSDNKPWWYAFFPSVSAKGNHFVIDDDAGSDTPDVGGMSVPYISNGDYSEYCEWNNYNSYAIIFRKGEFGAYTIN